MSRDLQCFGTGMSRPSRHPGAGGQQGAPVGGQGRGPQASCACTSGNPVKCTFHSAGLGGLKALHSQQAPRCLPGVRQEQGGQGWRQPRKGS